MKCNLLVRYSVQINAVNLEFIGVLASTAGNERVCPKTTAGAGQEPIRRRHHSPWRQGSQIEEMTAVQRDVLHRVFIDHLSHRDRLRIDDRCGTGFYLDSLTG